MEFAVRTSLVLATSTKALIRLGPNLYRSQEISCHLIPWIPWILSKSAFVICVWALESYIFLQPPGLVLFIMAQSMLK